MRKPYVIFEESTLQLVYVGLDDVVLDKGGKERLREETGSDEKPDQDHGGLPHSSDKSGHDQKKRGRERCDGEDGDGGKSHVVIGVPHPEDDAGRRVEQLVARQPEARPDPNRKDGTERGYVEPCALDEDDVPFLGAQAPAEKI